MLVHPATTSSPPAIPPMYTLLLLSCLSLLGLLNILGRRRRQRLPPGPPGLPVIGNILDLPKDGQDWISYQRWGEAYGTSTIAFNFQRQILINPLDTDVVYLNLVGSSVVVLNSTKAAQDLFDKRSNIYSGR